MESLVVWLLLDSTDYGGDDRVVGGTLQRASVSALAVRRTAPADPRHPPSRQEQARRTELPQAQTGSDPDRRGRGEMNDWHPVYKTFYDLS